MKQIIAGKYIEKDSPIHRLDPRTKAFALCCLIAYLLIWPDIIGHIFCLLLLLVATRTAKIQIIIALKFIWGARFFFYMAFLAHLLFTPGEGGYGWWIFALTLRGASNGLLFGLRLICLLWSAALFAWTTSPVELADGFRQTLSPLRRIGIDIDDIATMLLLAMRFVPTLIHDARELKYAQEARGAQFYSGGIIRRGKSVVPLIVPLFVGAFRRAEATAVALIIRGYELDEERTSLFPLKFGVNDWGGIICATFIVMIGICGRVMFSA